MTKKSKRFAAFVMAVAMIFSMQLYLPGNVYTDFGLGITVSAMDEISTGVTSTSSDTNVSTCATNTTVNPIADKANNEEVTTNGSAAALLTESATAITPTKPATGDGSEETPYQIGTAGELCWFAGLVNNDANVCTGDVTQNTSAKAVLAADIDLSGIDNWTPIGNSTNKYTGSFDGQNHTIKCMSITKQGYNSGLFGYTCNAVIKNIIITGEITITAESYTEGYGSIVGRAEYSTTVTNCHSSVNITVDSTMAATSECIGHIGGIVGKMHENTPEISNCSYSGTIELNDKNVKVAAGIVGYATNNSVPITNCSFTGKINSNYSGANYIGGIFGYTRTSGEVKVTNCLSAGTISKSGDKSLTGIIIGQINSGYGKNAVKNNYYLPSSSLEVFGTINGTPTTTPATLCDEKKLASGEVAYLLQGKQEEAVWGQTIGTDKYPVLGGAKVYLTTPCIGYSNSANKEHPAHDEYVNGFATCTVCGVKMYEPATVVSAEHHPELNGTHSGYYAIENAGQLCWFAGLVNNDANVCTGDVIQNTSASAVLTADIDLSSIDNWTPIGIDQVDYYGGTFDGNNHTINDMSITERRNYSGLFGRTNNATIKNIIITGKITITTESGEMRYGSIAGLVYDTIVTNCHSSVKITVNSKMDNTNEGIGFIGGIVGRQWIKNTNHAISNCSYSGSIELNVDNDIRTRYVGGIAGSDFIRVLITNCSFTGKINSNCSGANYIGGILGYTTLSKVNITNCLSVGTISKSEDTSQAGIIIGRITDASGANSMKNNYYSSSSSLGMFGSIDGTLTTTPATLCNEDQMASGEVAYLLQGEQEEVVWGQKLGENGDAYPVLKKTGDVGNTVYRNETYEGCEGNKGETVYIYSNTQEAPVYAEHTDADNDGKCDKCYRFMDGIGARLVGHSLTLDGSVGVNFYMELSAEVIADDTAYMQFTLPGGKTSKVNVSGAGIEVISGIKYYKFRCEVNAAEMTDTITAQLKSSVGYSKKYEYTVKEYADYLLAHKGENTEFAKAAAFIEAMVNYGSYAQIYAGYNADNLAVGDKANLKSVVDVTIDAYTYQPNENETKVKFVGANLSLLSTTTLRMYFKITDVEAESVTFTYKGNNLEKTKSGDYYYVELVGIHASELDDNFVVTVNDGKTPFDVTYTPMAYCANVVNRDITEKRTESLKNLIKALALYNRAADAYISQQQG